MYRRVCNAGRSVDGPRRLPCEDKQDLRGADSAFVAPFCAKNDHFAKTGSGQT
jgi:hypothetical protein